MAHAQADLLERARQYGKARAKREEAMAQLQKLVDLETNQSAHTVNIIPKIYDSYEPE